MKSQYRYKKFKALLPSIKEPTYENFRKLLEEFKGKISRDEKSEQFGPKSEIDYTNSFMTNLRSSFYRFLAQKSYSLEDKASANVVFELIVSELIKEEEEKERIASEIEREKAKEKLARLTQERMFIENDNDKKKLKNPAADPGAMFRPR